MPEFTFLLPCLNEERSVGACIDEIREAIERMRLNAEIIVADNGSVDGSREIAERHGAKVISVPERGYGAAIIAGINAANGEYIIMGDSDGSYDFKNTDGFVSALRSGCKLVMGNRFMGGIEKGAMPHLHRLGVPFLSFLGRVRFKVKVGDFHCGLRGFHRESALALGLCCTGMEFATELIAKFAMAGLSICEVKTVLRRDKRGKPSHLRTFRDGMRHLYYIFTKKAPRDR